MREGVCVPNVTFKCRSGDIVEGGGCGFDEGKWEDCTTKDLFGNKRVVVFSLPGAFTPTCTSQQLPGFEENYDAIKEMGVDEIYCVSVNDSFVMNKWLADQDITLVKPIPDGNGLFTRQMGMLVEKSNLGFGPRSWRYAAVVNNGVIEKWFEEPGRCDNCDDDPYGETSSENVMSYLKSATVKESVAA